MAEGEKLRSDILHAIESTEAKINASGRRQPKATRHHLVCAAKAAPPNGDEILRAVRFNSWQATHAGERKVKKAFRQAVFKHKLHQDAEFFERAYGYIREYY